MPTAKTVARILFTLAAVALVIVARRTVNPEVAFRIIARSPTAPNAYRNFTLLGLGLMPFLAAYGWSGLFSPAFSNRAKVHRVALGLFVLFVVPQTLFLRAYAAATYELAPVATRVALEAAAGGVGVAILAALVSRFGIGCGPLVLLAADYAAQIDWLASPLVWLPIALTPALAHALRLAQRVPLRTTAGGEALPFELPLVAAGITPINWATALVVLPVALLAAIQVKLPETSAGPWIKLVAQCGLTVFGAFFVTALSFNPVLLAEQLKERGLGAEGAEPGKPTAEALERVMNRLALGNGLVLVVLLVVPFLTALAAGVATDASWFFAPLVAAVALDFGREAWGRFGFRTTDLGEARDPVTALRALALLRAAGIEAVATSHASRLLVSVFGLYARVHVLVREGEADRARAILEPEKLLVA